jgi:hypothetical protein
MMMYKSTFIVAVLLMCVSFGAAHADVKYTVVTNYTSLGKSAAGSKTPHSSETITYFITANKKRMEYERKNLIYTSDDVRITRCDLNQRFRIDNALKIYTVSALNAKGIISAPTEKELTEDLPSGKVDTHISLQKVGSEKVNGIETTVYHVQMHTQYSGVLTIHESDYDGKMWIADVQGDMTCDSPKPLRASYTQIEDLSTGKRRVTYEITGDIDEMNAISSKLPMRQEGITGDSKISENITGLSTAELDDSLFEVPAGYRKVSSEEYEKLRSKAEFDTIQKAKKDKTQQ